MTSQPTFRTSLAFWLLWSAGMAAGLGLAARPDGLVGFLVGPTLISACIGSLIGLDWGQPLRGGWIGVLLLYVLLWPLFALLVFISFLLFAATGGP